MAGPKGLVVMENNILRAPVKIVLASSQTLLVVAVSPTEWSVMVAVSRTEWSVMAAVFSFSVDFSFPLSSTRLNNPTTLYNNY